MDTKTCKFAIIVARIITNRGYHPNCQYTIYYLLINILHKHLYNELAKLTSALITVAGFNNLNINVNITVCLVILL